MSRRLPGFLHCVTEAHGADGELQRKIDWDLLRQELSSDLVQGAEERYRLDWPGKLQACTRAICLLAKPCALAAAIALILPQREFIYRGR